VKEKLSGGWLLFCPEKNKKNKKKFYPARLKN